ncbi:leucine--tRNA ligase [Blattabacterium cuenoti]|uniref:leucine--tRNA ligase n=1 Tax=Blattabacterium cuenoti TaxID=1653831 RepID=UPI00163C3F37|nr:leucine--tRNA ligase [Blattabacterium cuenoti]
MVYNFCEIEKYWNIFWKKNEIFHVKEYKKRKKKYYILNMFPYPSGSGLHVGHCISYIATDIYARYLRMKGFNVLNPIGFDSFGLPAEQYAIQTGQHPIKTTYQNENMYTYQINKIGISFDWSRKLSTSDPYYYRWTQWMFIQLFNSWYDQKDDKAKSIHLLIDEFNKNGNNNIQAYTSYQYKFNYKKWKQFNFSEKEFILQKYRLAYLCKNIVNWCPGLGTVLANDEIKNGKSIRGGFLVYKKKMVQWHIRISAYADRLIKGMDLINCSKSLKKLQLNWIGKSIGILILLDIVYPIHYNKDNKLQVFFFSPEKIFGIYFIVLSTDHPLAKQIGLSHYKNDIDHYIKTNRFTNHNLKQNISGIFTGNYVFHPITRERIPIYISDFFPVDHQTKSMIGIPGHDIKSEEFSKKFDIKFKKVISCHEKKINKKCINSNFLNGLTVYKAKQKITKILIEEHKGSIQTSYKIRDAIFSRQRYWGEPIPIFFKKKIPISIPLKKLPIILPKINNFHPKEGKPPLSRSKTWAWDEKNMKIVSNKLIDYKKIFPMETNTMPCWAGSSWYFIRYMDTHNKNNFVDKKKEDYWKNVDLYIGGSEHGTGHLIYARFWHKFLKDRKWIQTEEPFKKIINQGMILNKSAMILKVIGKNIFVSYGLKNNKSIFLYQEIYVDIFLIKNKNELNINHFKKNHPKFHNAIFVLENGYFFCKRKLEKMSKSKYNVITPDYISKQYGADVLRLYMMFLGPITQSKPWNDEKINGIKNFINKFWRLFHKNGVFQISEDYPSFQEFRILHQTIYNINKKIQLFHFNTCISLFMTAVNDLITIKCNKRKILEPLTKLFSSFSPYISEELWKKLGKKKSIVYYSIPIHNKKFLIEKNITYPVMFNGKLKFLEKFHRNLTIEKIKNKILSHSKTKLFMKKKYFKKIIIIPKKIINILYSEK